MSHFTCKVLASWLAWSQTAGGPNSPDTRVCGWQNINLRVVGAELAAQLTGKRLGSAGSDRKRTALPSAFIPPLLDLARALVLVRPCSALHFIINRCINHFAYCYLNYNPSFIFLEKGKSNVLFSFENSVTLL